ncbi:Transthyretin-like family protein, partial [Cooperia oncophora]
MKYAILLALFGCAVAMRQQAVGVSGRLMCGNRPATGVKVKLWDEDDGPDPDDVLDEGYTDSNGEFRLQGSERELTNIDPVFKVYHDCDDGIKVRTICKLVLSMRIGDTFCDHRLIKKNAHRGY